MLFLNFSVYMNEYISGCRGKFKLFTSTNGEVVLATVRTVCYYESVPISEVLFDVKFCALL